MRWKQVCLPSVTSALFCGLYSGCATVTTTTTYVVRQSAIVPGATAPLIAGPAPEPGKWMVSAGGSGGLRGVGIDASGSVVADTGGRLTLGYSGSWWAVACGIDFLPRGLMHGGTVEGIDKLFVNEVTVMPTLGVRLRPARMDNFEMGLNIEASLADVPYVRNVDTTSVTTSTGFSSPPVTSPPTFSQSSSRGYTTLVVVRAGPNFGWHLGHGVAFSGGFLVANQPFVQGSVQVSQTCETSGIDTSCSGSTDKDVLIVDQGVAFTPYLAPSVTLGPVQIIAQLHANFSSNTALWEAAPAGGDVQVRLLF